ncbi:peptidoglycan/LPS O-acetylase OafA/YrhL [Actimicrobium sp. GrIS 1.19]|uniref:acyltransferase family protein n=1 Tax=Actimicrobium sp. GrIS 1.19 TaxID=3071708 RepID=UPI002E08C99F|nr:peptidoglycan/LPS O-acetylase OafA/YrhL [Actimicrobium sp. GrIS 1.19]
MSASQDFNRSAGSTERNPPFRSIELFKSIAVQLIVLHHLAFYGPMSDKVALIAPATIDWLDQHGRLAVQVFLVIGGFLAARSLSPHGAPGMPRPWRAVWRRYLKLVPPFLVATLLTVGAGELARQSMTHASISPLPGLAQLTSHALLLHSVLGYDSIAAGAWYVAIDFQLYALMTLLLWSTGKLLAGRPVLWVMPALVAVLAALSLLWFNRLPWLDDWAPYFFGSYGLGAIAWWARDPRHGTGKATLAFGVILVPAVLALMIDFRSRIALAVAVAIALLLMSRSRFTPGQRTTAHMTWISAMGRISYSVFLTHFAVCLLVNAWFTRFVPSDPWLQALGMLCAWAASLCVGALFFRWVEAPLGRLVQFGNAGPPRILSENTSSGEKP